MSAKKKNFEERILEIDEIIEKLEAGEFSFVKLSETIE